MISGADSSQKPVTTGVPQQSRLDPVLFNIFVNNVDNRSDCTLNKFVDDTRLGGLANMLEHHSEETRKAGEMG